MVRYVLSRQPHRLKVMPVSVLAGFRPPFAAGSPSPSTLGAGTCFLATFLVRAATSDGVAPATGTHHLEDHFRQLAASEGSS